MSHIRQVDAIAHVIRVFEDDDIHHVHGEIDPQSDKEVIEAELIMADVQTVEKRLSKALSETKSGKKDKVEYANIIQRLFDHLQAGHKARSFTDSTEELAQIKDLHLLTAKPFIYVVNAKENEVATLDLDSIRSKLALEDSDYLVPVSAKLEHDLLSFEGDEAQMFLEELGLQEPTLNTLIRNAYDILGLQTYFTAGVKEVRAWTVRKGATAPQAAGVIHTDFEKGFIKADVVTFQDFVDNQGWSKAKETGKVRLEGKEYIVQDGDVMLFKFNN